MYLHRLNGTKGFIGWEKCKSLHSYGPAIREYFILHFVINGKGRLVCEHGSLEIKKGQGFLISPGQINTYTADGLDPWEYVWVGIDDVPENRSALKRHGLDTATSVFDFSCDSWIFNDISSKCTNGSNLDVSRDIAAGYFYFLLDTIPCPKEKLLTADSYVEKSYRFMESNLHMELSVEALSKHLNVSRSYLYRVFKKALGISPQEALLDFKLEKADRLLQQHGGSVTQIAYSCGFCDASHFSKAYMKKYKKAPKNAYKFEKAAKA